MKTPARPLRVLASIIAFALIHASFGTQAWAQVVGVGAINAPIGGSAAAAAGIPSAGGSVAPALSLSNASLGTTFSAPSIAPIPQLSGIAAAPAALALAPSAAASADASRAVPAALVPAALVPAAVVAAAASKSEAPDAEVSPAASKAAPAAVTTGPLTGRVASKASSIISGVRAFFGGKTAETAPAVSESASALTAAPLSAPHTSDLTPAQDDAAHAEAASPKSEPPAPPAAPEDGGGKSWFGLGKPAVFFIGSLVVAQIGVEALGAAMPALVQKTFGDFTVVAQLGIFASIASIIGRQLGPVAVTKWGLRKVYLIGTATRIVSISILCALLATGHMTLPLMMAFYCLNGLIGGVTMTAESSIPPALMGGSQAKIEKFWTWEQTLLEIIGVSGPIVTGAVVVSMGFLPALIAFPATFAIALAILFFTLRIPQKVEAMRLADLAKKQAEPNGGGVKNAFGDFFRKIAEGAKLVWHSPLLRTSFLAYTVYTMLNPFLYSMIAPAFGIRLVGADNMAAVYGLLTGLYSLGGLLGGFLMIREQKKLTAAKQKGMSDAEETEALRKSMLRWMKWGVVGLLAILTLAFPIAPLSAFVTLPGFLSWAGALTLPALALIPFGVAQVIATVKLKSYFQSKVPEGRMPQAMGFFGSASLVVSTVGLLALKYLFKGVAGFTPFWIIAALMIPLGIYYLYLTRVLDKASAPTPPAK